MERTRSIVTWLLQILLGGVFVLVGVGKFAQWDGWVSRFEMWGYAAWFLALIAILEGVGGVMVLVPRIAAYGAGLIGAIMLGAAYTHWSTGIGQVSQVVPQLIVCGAVLLLRWRDRWQPGLSDGE